MKSSNHMPQPDRTPDSFKVTPSLVIYFKFESIRILNHSSGPSLQGQILPGNNLKGTPWSYLIHSPQHPKPKQRWQWKLIPGSPKGQFEKF